jgi:hypothetical protein
MFGIQALASPERLWTPANGSGLPPEQKAAGSNPAGGTPLSSVNMIACNIRATRRSRFAPTPLRSDCCPAGPGTSREKAHTVESDDDRRPFVPSDAEWKG